MIVYDHPLGEVRLNNGAALLVLENGTEIALSDEEEAAWFEKLAADNDETAAANLTGAAPSDDLARVLAELVAVEAEAFETDTEVDCGDFVAWFAELRPRLLKAVRGGPLAPREARLRAALQTCRDALDEAAEVHVWAGEARAPDCNYTAAVREADAALALTPAEGA